MNIYNENNGKFYGKLGTKTDLTDDLGISLFVGDIVMVGCKHGNWSRLSFVCQYENNGECYIPAVPHVRPEDANDFTCEKVLGFSVLSNGFKFGEFKIV